MACCCGGVSICSECCALCGFSSTNCSPVYVTFKMQVEPLDVTYSIPTNCVNIPGLGVVCGANCTATGTKTFAALTKSSVATQPNVSGQACAWKFPDTGVPAGKAPDYAPSAIGSVSNGPLLQFYTGVFDVVLNITVVNGQCTATLEATQTNIGQLSLNLYANGNPASGYFSASRSSASQFSTNNKASASTTFSCLSDLVGLSVSVTAHGITSSSSVSSSGSCRGSPPAASTLDVAGGNCVFSIESISLLP